MNINHIVLEGNLTAAATLSHWTNGTAYARFTLANNRSYKDQNGEWQEIVSFIDCMIKGSYAEAKIKDLLKGRHATVEGRIRQNRWSDDKGNHSAVYIEVENISFPPGAFTPKADTPDAQQQPAGPEPTENFDDLDAGIPF